MTPLTFEYTTVRGIGRRVRYELAGAGGDYHRIEEEWDGGGYRETGRELVGACL